MEKNKQTKINGTDNSLKILVGTYYHQKIHVVGHVLLIKIISCICCIGGRHD